jgi:hypothetical protein
MHASLAETFMWTKFQVKIQKYDFYENVGSCRENWLKLRYLARNKLSGNILSSVQM